jgi:hypothetical protein
MPTLATKLSQEKRRANTSNLPGANTALQQSTPTTNTVHPPRITGPKEVRIIGQAKQGTVPSQQHLEEPTATDKQNQQVTIPESESEEEDEHEERFFTFKF